MKHNDKLHMKDDLVNFNFWHKWLLFVSLLLTAGGLAIAFFPNSFIFDMHTDAIERHFFNDLMPEEAADLRAFLFGPLGGTIAGYFLIQTFIVWKPFYRREPWAWHAILWPLLLWFVADSGMSIYHGAFFNVWIVNLWTLILVGLPLVVTRKMRIKKA